MLDINGLGTEQRNDKTKDLDLMSTMEIIQIMNEEDLNVVAGVKKALPQIEKVVGVMQETLKNGGRIVYVGAGTSGRTGIIDAVECGPTFSCTYEYLGLIAGGYGAIVKAVEGAEDRKDFCVKDLKDNNIDFIAYETSWKDYKVVDIFSKHKSTSKIIKNIFKHYDVKYTISANSARL